MTGLPANKLYYRIGEIARWLEVKPHVLRHWQAEFAQFFMHSERSKKGQRVFNRREAITFATIKELLYVELYTTEGAKRQLRLARERLGQVG